MRYYEDLVEGEEMRSGSRQGRRRRRSSSLPGKYDPQYFHADARSGQALDIRRTGRVRDFHHGRCGGSSITRWRGDIAWICGVAWDDVKFQNSTARGGRSAGPGQMSQQAALATAARSAAS